jgi:hypothetical protein
MFNSSLLDSLIACVVVILVLSLMVQAIQTAVKKLLKLKSRQIEDSLVDLFQNSLDQLGHKDFADAKPQHANARWQPIRERFKTFVNKSPVLRLAFGDHPVDLATGAGVKPLYLSVCSAFQEVGRVTARGNLMFDSLAKEDLLKILDRVGVSKITPESADRVKALIAAIGAVPSEIDLLKSAVATAEGQLTEPATKATFADIKSLLLPVLDDVALAITGRKIDDDVLLGDVRKLGNAKTRIKQLLSEIEQKIQAQVDAANQATPANSAVAAALGPVMTAINAVNSRFTALAEQVEAALGQLRSRMTAVENWFDTIMQSFDERYTRGMKTWAILISLAVVVPLNANVFDLYKNVSTSAVLRDTLVRNGDKIVVDASKRGTSKQPMQTAATSGNPQTAQSAPAAATSATATPAQTDKTVQSIVKETQSVIEPYMKDYANFGFRPFGSCWNNWCKSSLRMEQGWSWPRWWRYRLHDLWHILGWISMALLLSVGAPFWEDTLESLFGVKTLLRDKSSTRNVEQQSGAGQPKP